MKTINDFDLSSKQGRYQARKHGFNVPIFKPYGLKQKPDFWSFVNVKTENECWNWLGNVNQWGYGRLRHDGWGQMAHRVAYEKKTGKSIKGLIAMHICDNPACCNPKHISLGTHADNQHDKINKNRQAKGEIVGTSILTNEQVLEARGKYKPKVVTYKMLAKEYGVCKDTMQKAIRGIYWKHI
jgi:hypothetical protein